MVTQTTEIERRDTRGIGAQIAMTALTLAALGALALWQVRPGGDGPARKAAIASRGDVAERYVERHGTAPPRGAPTLVDSSGVYLSEYEAEAQVMTVDLDRQQRPAPHTLIVASADDIVAAYGDLMERMRALDGGTPIRVTVAADGSMIGAISVRHNWTP